MRTRFRILTVVFISFNLGLIIYLLFKSIAITSELSVTNDPESSNRELRVEKDSEIPNRLGEESTIQFAIPVKEHPIVEQFVPEIKISSHTKLNSHIDCYTIEGFRKSLGISDTRASSISVVSAAARIRSGLRIYVSRAYSSSALEFDLENLVSSVVKKSDSIQFQEPASHPAYSNIDDYRVGAITDSDPVKLGFFRGKRIIKEMPWDKNKIVFPSWYTISGNIGISLIKLDDSHQYVSALFVDKKRSQIMGDVSFPKSNITPYINMVVDEKNSAAIFFDYRLDWLTIVDFKKLSQ